MLEVGLTGCRFSGKTSVSKLFRKIGVPVFDADIILKFILNFKPKVELAIMSNVGSFVYKNGFLDPTCFLTDGLFDRTIDVIEFELFQAWERFKDKHKDHSYVIFESSILFERKWEEKFDKVISVYAPKDERIYRAMTLGNKIDKVRSNVNKEISDNDKNVNSDYIIHNYDHFDYDILKQANLIDIDLVDLSLNSNFRKIAL